MLILNSIKLMMKIHRRAHMCFRVCFIKKQGVPSHRRMVICGPESSDRRKACGVSSEAAFVIASLCFLLLVWRDIAISLWKISFLFYQLELLLE